MLPNEEFDKIKVYPNEYINNITVNRPNARLLENDLYLDSKFPISGDVPVTSSVSGELGQIRVDDSFLYIYNGIQWGRIPLDTSF